MSTQKPKQEEKPVDTTKLDKYLSITNEYVPLEIGSIVQLNLPDFIKLRAIHKEPFESGPALVIDIKSVLASYPEFRQPQFYQTIGYGTDVTLVFAFGFGVKIVKYDSRLLKTVKEPLSDRLKSFVDDGINLSKCKEGSHVRPRYGTSISIRDTSKEGGPYERFLKLRVPLVVLEDWVSNETVHVAGFVDDNRIVSTNVLRSLLCTHNAQQQSSAEAVQIDSESNQSLQEVSETTQEPASVGWIKRLNAHIDAHQRDLDRGYTPHL